jgi:hypothetical protein
MLFEIEYHINKDQYWDIFDYSIDESKKLSSIEYLSIFPLNFNKYQNYPNMELNPHLLPKFAELYMSFKPNLNYHDFIENYDNSFKPNFELRIKPHLQIYKDIPKLLTIEDSHRDTNDKTNQCLQQLYVQNEFNIEEKYERFLDDNYISYEFYNFRNNGTFNIFFIRIYDEDLKEYKDYLEEIIFQENLFYNNKKSKLLKYNYNDIITFQKYQLPIGYYLIQVPQNQFQAGHIGIAYKLKKTQNIRIDKLVFHKNWIRTGGGINGMAFAAFT